MATSHRGNGSTGMTPIVRRSRRAVVVPEETLGCTPYAVPTLTTYPEDLSRGRGAHEPRLVRKHHELSPVAGSDLCHCPAHMGLRGQGGNDEPLCDLVIAEPRRNQDCHLAFSLGQRINVDGW